MGKSREKREHSPKYGKYCEIPDLWNPGNQRVNPLKRVIDREEEIKRKKENERGERERES